MCGSVVLMYCSVMGRPMREEAMPTAEREAFTMMGKYLEDRGRFKGLVWGRECL